MLVLLLVIFLIGTFCLVAKRSEQDGETVHAQFISLTNGTVGTMSSTYAGFASNNATVVRRWIQRGTNTALVRVTNEGRAGVWLFPFMSIEGKTLKQDALLLNAANYSGILLPGHSATNVEIAIFEPTLPPWRARLEYTKDTSADSLLRRLSRLPRELAATLKQQALVEQTTSIETDWIVEDASK